MYDFANTNATQTSVNVTSGDKFAYIVEVSLSANQMFPYIQYIFTY